MDEHDVKHMSLFERGVPGSEWDQQVAAMDGSVLQSRGWAQFQTALGKEVVYAAGDGWAWLGYLMRPRGGSYLYAPYGPTVRDQAALGQAATNLRESAAALKADFVRLEPVGSVTEAEVRALGGQAVSENQPQRTIVMDLRPEVDALRHNLAQSNRNLINTAEARGVQIVRAQSPAEAEAFLELVTQTVQHQKIRLYDAPYFKTLLETLMPTGVAQLHYAMYQGRYVAGAITLDFAHTRYYLFAASDFELNREAKAAVPLLWHLIMQAKELGLTWFDFYGIAPTDDPNDKKAGITRFKMSFDRNVVTRVGTWELPVRGAKYQLYRWAKKTLR